MSNVTRAVLIGFGVAFAVAIAFGFLMGLDGQSHTGTVVTSALGAGVIAAYISGNLAGNRKIASASDDQKREALGRAPPAGKALLYVYREGFVAKLAGLNITIDGRDVAQLKAPRFTCFVVPAGAHVVSARFGGLAGPQSKPGEISIDTPADGQAAIRITIAMGALQGGVVLTPQSDIGAVKQVLARMPMTPPDVAEL